MANKTLFKNSSRGRTAPQTDTKNRSGSRAYKEGPKAALAQLAATGTLSDTFYATAGQQLDQVKSRLNLVGVDFLGKLALFSRQRGYMKDMPALLVAHLATRGDEGRTVLKKVFPLVIDNGRMLRNFVQILRSGTLGRKSLGSCPKKLVRKWLDSKSDYSIFRASVGNDPSLADIIKMVHPKAKTPSRNALYAYLIGRKHEPDALPEIVREFEEWKKGKGTGAPPKVDFRQLTSLPLTPVQWGQIAHDGGWHMVRMNLNTFHRHGVFNIKGMEEAIARKLRDPEAIKRAKVFPYQLLTAYIYAGANVPHGIREALQDALEIATENVPAFGGQTYVCVDTSGSMGAAITGRRPGATSKIRCIDVAGLIASTVVRTNRNAEVIPFATDVKNFTFNPRDSVMTNADKLRRLGGGGTNCASPLAYLNRKRAKGDLVIFVSDYESWSHPYRYSYNTGTAMAQEWEAFNARNPQSKLVCIDLTPGVTTQVQAKGDPRILKVGGFADVVFDVIREFALGDTGPGHWLNVIESTNLDAETTERTS